MEDEEEVQSHPSGDSGSPGSSTPPPPSQRSNGRITVTVATVPPQSQNNLTLALPIQRQQQQATPTTRATGNSGGGGGGGGREDCWSEGATSVLIDAWGERYLELSRGNLKQKHWKDVADIVSSREDYGKAPKTDIQCKNRIDTVKKKYKLEKAKIAAGGAPSKWPFYDRLDRLIGPSAKVVAAAGPSSLPLQYSGTSSQRVPMGIPMGARSAPPQFKQHHQQEKFAQQQQQQKQKQQQQQLFRKRHIDSDDDEEEESEREPSPDSTDDFPPGSYDRKRPKIQQEFVNIGSSGMKPGMMTNRGKDEKGNNNAGEKNWGNAVKELTQAIMKFGEAYEQAETLKLQQLVDMEKQRMKFAKEMELQRMQFFMKTQLELSQLKSSSSSSGRRVGNSNNNINHRGSNNNNVANHNNNNTNNNSDSSK